MHRYHNLKQNNAASLPFLKLSFSPNHSISMDIGSPLNPASEGNHYFFAFVDHFSNCIATVPTPKNKAHHTLNLIFQHSKSTFRPPYNRITDRRTVYLNYEMASYSILFNIRHWPRTSYVLWRKRFVEVQNEKLGTHLRLFSQSTAEDPSFLVHFLLMPAIINQRYNCMFNHMNKFLVRNNISHRQLRIPMI